MCKKSFMFLVLSIILSVVFLTGCVTTQSGHEKIGGMIDRGQHQEATDYFEETFNYEMVDLNTLLDLCNAYVEMANYGKYYECKDAYINKLNILKNNSKEFFRNDSKGSNNVRLRKYFPYMFPKTAVFSYEDYVNLMRIPNAIVNIDLGNYNLALQEAESVILHYETTKPFFLEGNLWVLAYEKEANEYLLKMNPTALYRLSGISNALLGRRREAEDYINSFDSLKGILYSRAYGWASEEYVFKERQEAILNIYTALKDFAEAKKILEHKLTHTTDLLIVPLLALAALNNPLEAVLQLVGYLDSKQDIRRYSLVKDIRINFLHCKIAYETGDLDSAKQGYDKLLSNPITKNFGNIYFAILHDQGNIILKEGNYEKAIDLFKQSINVIESQRSSINTEASRIGFVGDKQSVYMDLVALLFEKGRYAEAFEYVERGKARALVDMLATKKTFSSKNIDKDQVTVLLDELAKMEVKSLNAYNQTDPEQYASTRALEVQQKEKIVQTDTELASLVKVSPQNIAEIQKLLPADETLIEYYGTGDTNFAFVVTSDDVQAVKLEAKDLGKEISKFREGITLSPEEARAIDVKTSTASTTDQVNKQGQVLYEILIRPLEGMIASKNLTIVPHGKLHYLPFSALYSDEGHLIDNYNIRVLPSASVMKFLKKQKEDHAGSLLAFGNPDLNNPLLDLPGAQEEVLAITKDIPDAKVLLRKQATETAVKRFGEQFQYIHFATHGTFNAEKPLTSGLMLSGDGENDGTLTVGELYDLRLNSDMVTLSACETALGKVANGDDVVGFSRGFLYAGVSTIVSSLWKVDDKATSILMQGFYKSLIETDKRNALRTAQLKVKDTYNSHPYFWAAFQITGAVQ